MLKRYFYKEIGNIYRLKVPFEDLYTSVFLIKARNANVLVDCATYASDVEEWIIPALKELGLCLKDINYLILTHKHGDHAGGLSRILEYEPTLQVLDKIRSLDINKVTVCEMKGHTLDCIGVLDECSGTLISGDGLQGAGVGKYRCSLEDRKEYLKTIDKIKEDKRIKNVLFSHAYEPWDKDGAFGREEIKKCLEDCIEYAERR